MKLAGRVAVITGGASGIGKSMAERFAAEGARVVVADWNAAQLTSAVDGIRTAGGEAVAVPGNVAEQADCDVIIDAAMTTYGRLDVLCNNAGVMDLFAGVAEMDDATFERCWAINLRGPVFLTRRTIPIMKAQGGGSIIMTTSAAGLGGGSAGAAYTMSKHALVGLTKNTALRYIADGIRCNAIAPGGVATAIMSSVDRDRLDRDALSVWSKYHAISPGTLSSSDVANLALFLASNESVHINGAIIRADLGWAAY